MYPNWKCNTLNDNNNNNNKIAEVNEQQIYVHLTWNYYNQIIIQLYSEID